MILPLDAPDSHVNTLSGASAKRLRCVHYLRSIRLEHGGVVRAVLDICGGLAATGHDVTLVTFDAADVPAAWNTGAPGLPRTVHFATRKDAAAGGLDALIAGADVLHLHTPWDPINISFARTARRRRVPYILSIHGMLDRWSVRQKWLKKRIYLALAGSRFLWGAAVVHCTAEAELDQAARFLRPGTGRVAPYLVDSSTYANLPGPELAARAFSAPGGGAPRLLFLSRLHPKKRPDLLIEAAARLKAGGLPTQIVLAGPAAPKYEAWLQQLARRRGLEQDVIFTGMVRGDLKVSLYQTADVFVLPSSQENFGYVLIESLAAGTPIITTRGVDIWEELQRAGALIVEPTPEAITDAAQILLRDLPRARQLGQQGREWVFRELAPAKVIGLYEQLYRRAVNMADNATR